MTKKKKKKKKLDHWRNQRGNQKRLRKMKTQWSKNVGMQQKQFKREVYSNTILPQETRKISNKQPTLHLEQLEKEEQTKPKVSRRE